MSTVSVVLSATLFSAVHFSSFVSSIVMTRSSSLEISARIALFSKKVFLQGRFSRKNCIGID